MSTITIPAVPVPEELREHMLTATVDLLREAGDKLVHQSDKPEKVADAVRTAEVALRAWQGVAGFPTAPEWRADAAADAAESAYETAASMIADDGLLVDEAAVVVARAQALAAFANMAGEAHVAALGELDDDGNPVSPVGDTDDSPVSTIVDVSPFGDKPGITIPAGPLSRLREHTGVLVERTSRALSDAEGHPDQEDDMVQAIAYRRHLAGAGPYSPKVVAHVAAECVSWDAARDVEWPTRVDDEAAVAIADHLGVIRLRDECSAVAGLGAMA